MDSCPEVAVYAGKLLAALVDSGAAVSLIHLQAYKLMPDTLKTAMILPGEIETLTTADGSPTHIIGHATITLHLKNLRVTHHFHRSRITDDKHHIGYRLPVRIQNII